MSGSYQVDNIRMRYHRRVTPEVYSSWTAFFNVVAHRIWRSATSPSIRLLLCRIISLYCHCGRTFYEGTAYAYLVQNWGLVPIITDNIVLLILHHQQGIPWSLYVHHLYISVLPRTTSLLRLQQLPFDEWSAEGMLAKCTLPAQV